MKAAAVAAKLDFDLPASTEERDGNESKLVPAVLPGGIEFSAAVGIFFQHDVGC